MTLTLSLALALCVACVALVRSIRAERKARKELIEERQEIDELQAYISRFHQANAEKTVVFTARPHGDIEFRVWRMVMVAGCPFRTLIRAYEDADRDYNKLRAEELVEYLDA